MLCVQYLLVYQSCATSSPSGDGSSERDVAEPEVAINCAYLLYMLSGVSK